MEKGERCESREGLVGRERGGGDIEKGEERGGVRVGERRLSEQRGVEEQKTAGEQSPHHV